MNLRKRKKQLTAKTHNRFRTGGFMNDLIKINYGGEQPTVSARELHKMLNVEKRFSAWFEVNS